AYSSRQSRQMISAYLLSGAAPFMLASRLDPWGERAAQRESLQPDPLRARLSRDLPIRGEMRAGLGGTSIVLLKDCK
ncbi:hypothetical protein, partial [Aporhodopirellula aestuarii]